MTSETDATMKMFEAGFPQIEDGCLSEQLQHHHMTGDKQVNGTHGTGEEPPNPSSAGCQSTLTDNVYPTSMTSADPDSSQDSSDTSSQYNSASNAAVASASPTEGRTLRSKYRCLMEKVPE